MLNLITRTPAYSRKKFLTHVGAGVITAASLPFAAIASPIEKELTPDLPNDKDPDPIRRSPLNTPTEQAEPKFYPAPDNPRKRKGYAIVGLGHLTLDEILPAFSACKHSRAVALVSGDSAKAAVVADQYGINPKSIYSYADFDRIADNPEIDAVYIVLPNSMHHEFTIRAANAGKHVLCEKPMANSVKECEEMIEACKKASKKLMVAYRIQYDPNNKLMQKWCREKEYGSPKIVESYNGQHIGDPTQWRLNKKLAGGGALPDIGIYCLNTCRFLLGEEPEWVQGHIYSTPGDSRFKEVEETVMFQMQFPGGTLASCVSSYGAHMSRRYRVFADKGAWFGMDPAFSYKGLRLEISQAKEKREWRQNPSVVEKNQFALEMDHFSQCIATDTTPFTPGEEGLQDQRIIEAIYRSAKDGSIVKLNKYTGLDVFRGPAPKDEE